MKFIDEVQVSFISGDGGDGCSSFREKNSFPKVGQVVEMEAKVEMLY